MALAARKTVQKVERPISRWSAATMAKKSAPNPNFIAILAVAAICTHLLLRYLVGFSALVSDIPLFAAVTVGGVPLLIVLLRKLAAREFGSDLLAGISIVTSVILGEYLVAAIVILMLSGGTALEQWASRRASSVLDALARRMPQVAHRKRGAHITDISLVDIAVGDLLVVFPHEITPVDGVVSEGQGKMNEAYLTGEPFEISKTPGSDVISGAVNGESALTIRAVRLPIDSRYARIMQVMQETQQRRPSLRRLGDKLGAWYTPAAVGLALIAWVATRDPGRFLAVLVVATPCPLIIAIPVAIIGAISLAARRGIIIKNPAVLEQIDRCRTLIFDKTGTLTYGKPSLSEIICAPGFDRETVLRLAASVESYSKHPLSGAILKAAENAKLLLEPVSAVSERPGEGLRGAVRDHNVWITGRASLHSLELNLPPIAPGLECLVFLDGQFAASFRFEDAPRGESSGFVRHLKPRHAVSRVLLVSGDRRGEVEHLAAEVGIDQVFAAQTPEQKVEIVRRESANAPTLFLGDGINDAPAMQAATVGVAFGAKNDITAEAADVVVLETSLSRVDELIHIGRRMRRIALQSAVGGMALSACGMIAAALGLLPPIGGAVAQEIIDLAAVLNAVRVAIYPGKMSDF
ncbi:MAG TPA: heavy metal translocating P-type ATPase [Candidatus Dormibacteraeota bacterium]|nr:heavy metal translocating P-type ATPase [Candidatus Dormibacteraeota bacterium]